MILDTACRVVHDPDREMRLLWTRVVSNTNRTGLPAIASIADADNPTHAAAFQAGDVVAEHDQALTPLS
jgi:hypothetical protein